ncbi:GerAB/ArcD/ProY family transporter [Clostridium oryzae]|uniref:Spore germination protein B2 n=1 Tax=Clostridium oryzae TaxID=1450648 RepID=A0A1V4IDU0_9CLOT|nr:endospore germination permease [Clostridium oryzae]OPJ58096.1 spore germination protein B2 [Clostridium oryzae]
MNLKKGIIPNIYLTFLFVQLFQASNLITSFITDVTKQDTWIVSIASWIITLGLLAIYLGINSKLPDKTIIEINDIAFGKYLGKIISVIYILFFWFVIPANVRYVADFFNTYLFPDTDVIVFAFLIMLMAIYALRKGIEGIVRIAAFLVVITFFVSIFLIIFTTRYIKFSNFLPLFQITFMEFIHGVNVIVCIPLGEIIVYLMIYPSIKEKKSIKKYSYLGFCIGGFYFLMIIVRNTLVLGNIASIQVIPTYQVARLVVVGNTITRSEILVAIMLFFGLFLKICIFFYAAVLGITQLFKLNSYKVPTFPVGIISGILSISMFASQADETYIGSSIYPVFILPVIVVIPIVTLVVLKVKNIQKHNSIE